MNTSAVNVWINSLLRTVWKPYDINWWNWKPRAHIENDPKHQGCFAISLKIKYIIKCYHYCLQFLAYSSSSIFWKRKLMDNRCWHYIYPYIRNSSVGKCNTNHPQLTRKPKQKNKKSLKLIKHFLSQRCEKYRCACQKHLLLSRLKITSTLPFYLLSDMARLQSHCYSHFDSPHAAHNKSPK